MVSFSREKDRELRLNYLEVMKIALSMGFVEYAKWFGLEARSLKEKISNYDYKQEDKFQDRIEKDRKLWTPK